MTGLSFQHNSSTHTFSQGLLFPLSFTTSTENRKHEKNRVFMPPTPHP